MTSRASTTAAIRDRMLREQDPSWTEPEVNREQPTGTIRTIAELATDAAELARQRAMQDFHSAQERPLNAAPARERG